MAGGPSQLDLFDHKPALNQYDGQPVPEELIKGERFAFIKGVPKLLGSPTSSRNTASRAPSCPTCFRTSERSRMTWRS